MIITDTHTHLYLDHFNDDRDEVVQNTIQRGVKYMLLPNIDSNSVNGMLELCNKYPNNCFPMMGLHPTNVKENYKEELASVENWLTKRKFIAIGEIGIDLYWDKTFYKEQEYCFRTQIDFANTYNLPIVIHSRKSMNEIFSILKNIKSNLPKGVFHCFSGNIEDAQQVIDLGFYLGIGGVITFKNSKLENIGKKIGLNRLLLETDAPFLTPSPYRGKRNKSAYTFYIAEKIAELKQISIEEVAMITTQNARNLFKF
jgi:TatD DNase family protein